MAMFGRACPVAIESIVVVTAGQGHAYQPVTTASASHRPIAAVRSRRIRHQSPKALITFQWSESSSIAEYKLGTLMGSPSQWRSNIANSPNGFRAIRIGKVRRRDLQVASPIFFRSFAVLIPA